MMMLFIGQDGAADAVAAETVAVEPWTMDRAVDALITAAPKVIGVLVVLFVAWTIAGWASRLVQKGMTKAQIDQTLSMFAGRMAKWAILLLSILGCLGWVGIDVTSFAAVIAAAGFAIGLAFQGTLSNFSAGVMLLVFRPFKVGDVIDAGGVSGKVNEIQLFTTTLDTPDNRRLIVPNSVVFGSTIENKSFHPTRRVDVSVGTDYGADLDKTREVLMKAASDINGRLAREDAVVVLTGLGDSCIDWSVRVWVDSGDYFPVKEALTNAVKYALDAAEIGIPYPQMDVHMDKVGGA